MDGGSVIIPHPAYAKRHLAYLRCMPHTWWALRRVGREDALQNIWLAWLELGRPEGEGLNKAVLRRAWLTISAQALRMGREVLYRYDTIAEAPAPPHPFIAAVVDHYASHTASETIAHFGLPDTARVRYWLGRCLPKPRRASGRKFGERRVRVATACSSVELVAQGLSRATAWRAAKRGWYWGKVEEEKPARKRPELFRFPVRKPMVRVSTACTHRELMARGLPESTARDAAKRGWYMS